MRMSNKMRELRAQIDEQREKLRKAVEVSDVDGAKSAKEELEKISALYDAAETEFDLERKMAQEPEEDADDGNKEEKAYNASLFYKAVCGAPLSDREKKLVSDAKAVYKSQFSEGSKSEGGYTVPDDLSKQIFESIQSQESVRNLVSVEPVRSLTGSRLFRDGDKQKLYNLEEYEEIKEMNNPKYSPVTYKQHKFGAIMTISNELLEDSFVNFNNEIVDWLSRAARNTENTQIFYGASGEKHAEGLLSTSGAFREINGGTLSIDLLRKVWLSLKSGYRTEAVWIMNSLAFAAISELKDKNDRSYLQPDPRNAAQYYLLGNLVQVYDAIETEESKTVIAFGDFKRAYRMFPRKDFGIAFTDIGAGAFETDSLKAKGIERFDGRIFDREAAVIIRDVPVVPLDFTDNGEKELTGDVTEATLKNMTKAQLIDFANDCGIEGITGEQTKDAIVTAILADLA